MKYYFKVWLDYNQYIPIDETELEKALYAFQTGKPVIFNMGAASRIQSIVPDFNKSLGWNSDYKPKAEDVGEVDALKLPYREHMNQVKEKITNQLYAPELKRLAQ